MKADLRLPEIDDGPSLGSKLARWAVSVTMVCLVLLGGSALVALFSVTLDVGIDAAGALELQTVWPVRSPVAGVVEAMPVTTGERVHPGQVLARLDSFDLASSLEKLRLEASVKRHRREASRGELEILDQQIRATEDELSRRVVVGVGNGVVLTEELDDLVGSQVGAGELLFEVAALDRWQAELLVIERDIHLIRIGDPVKIVVPAVASLESWQNLIFPGKVTFIGSDPIRDRPEAQSYYRVLADLDSDRIGSDHLARFKRGMSVEARVVTRSARAVDLLVRHLFHRGGAA